MQKLTHTNPAGEAQMVDISNKDIQLRVAQAKGCILMNTETIILLQENKLKKGDAIATARIAGIQAAKSTSSLIPLCHNILLTKVEVDIQTKTDTIEVTSTVSCVGKTGVEMEALTAVSIALLTIYDMCKAVDKNMIMKDIKLIEKSKTDVSHA